MIILKKYQVMFFEIISSVLEDSFECEVQVEQYKKANLDGYQTTMKGDGNISANQYNEREY